VKLNAKTMAWYLASRSSSRFHYRRHQAVVSNLSWGFLDWEADLIVLTKSGHLKEIEIKVSMTDWKNDELKAKFMRHPNGSGKKDWQYIREFWYAVPEGLADRHGEVWTPDGSGIIAVGADGKTKVIRPAKPNRDSKVLTDKQQMTILRLGAMRAWTREGREIAAEEWDDSLISKEIQTDEESEDIS